MTAKPLELVTNSDGDFLGANVWVNCYKTNGEACCTAACLTCQDIPNNDKCTSCDPEEKMYLSGTNCIKCDDETNDHLYWDGQFCIYTMNFRGENWYLVRRKGTD